MSKVMLAMSGGVDSSVAVHILKKAGHEVQGITMDLGQPGTVEKAAAAAKEFGIMHHVADLKEHFDKLICENFSREYAAGRTPNPCVLCNEQLKLGILFEVAKQVWDFDYFATGHYVQNSRQGGRYALRRAVSDTKDQSYYLYRLPQEVLAKTIFPLGDLEKTEVREIAAELGLASAEAKDSQDICFIPDGDYRKFLAERNVVGTPGNFVDKDGKVLGTHQGIVNYTVGQRKGLGIALGKPVFVTELRPETNEVVLGDETDLLAPAMLVEDCVWQAVEGISGMMFAEVKLRYKSQPVPCTLKPEADGRVLVRFLTPQKSPTPGQSAVFYAGDVVLGGGFIVGPVK